MPGRDPCQRLAGLVERQHRFDLRAEFAPIDQAGQLLKPQPTAGGSECFAGDAPLQPKGCALQGDGHRPAAVADRVEGPIAGLTASGVEQQVDSAGNRGTHLPGPVGGVVVEDLAGTQAPQ